MITTSLSSVQSSTDELEIKTISNFVVRRRLMTRVDFKDGSYFTCLACDLPETLERFKQVYGGC